MNGNQVLQLLELNKLMCGRMVSASKRAPAGETCVWNANIVTKTHGKVWFGDLNLNRDGETLKRVAESINEPLYVLRESDCRFGTENDPIELIIDRSVWNTNK